MRKEFRKVLERTEKIKRKPIDKTFYYSESRLQKKVKEEEKLNMILKEKLSKQY